MINSGLITGGLADDKTARADAIDFTGGVNSLTLEAGAKITGLVVAFSVADTLALGGTASGAFNVSSVGSSAQYQGFGVFKKTGSGTWTLTGVTSAHTPWAINSGALAVSSDGTLGDPSGALSFGGGALKFLAGFSTSRRIVLNAAGGSFDTNGKNATLAGLISGVGALTETGAGTLTLSHSNSYSGGTSLQGGTLDLSALKAAGTSSITFGTGSESLKIENAALSADNFGNTVQSFGSGDAIDLTGLIFATGAAATYNTSTHILAVTSGGVTDTLHLADPAGAMFAVSGDGASGTKVTLAGVGSAALNPTDLGFSSGANSTVGFSGTAGTPLTVGDGAHIAKIALLGNYMNSTFVASSDGHGGTLIAEIADRPPSASGAATRNITWLVGGSRNDA